MGKKVESHAYRNWHTMELNKALRILATLILFASASAATTGESGVEEGNLGYFLIAVVLR